jgi:hypothetical protein
MGYHYYNYLIWRENTSNTTLADVKDLIETSTNNQGDLVFGSAATVLLEENCLTLSLNGWQLWIHLDKSNHVAEEALEAADWAEKDGTARPGLRNCSSRFDMYAEDDPDETYYHEQLYIIDWFCEQPGLHVYDPYLGCYLP